MKFHTLTRRAVTAGAASALVAGALVGATGPAQADVVTNTYTCHSSSDFPVTMTGSSAILDSLPGAAAGLDVPAGLLGDLGLTFTVPDSVVALLSGAGIDHVAIPDFAATIGNTDVPVTGLQGAVADMVDNGNGTHSFSAVGSNLAFEVPAAGTYDVTSPAAFTIDALTGSTTLLSVPCEIASGTTPGVWRTDFPVTKNDSTTTAKAKDATVRKRDGAAIVVKVAAPNERPTGTVVLKRGTKTLDKGKLKRGKVVLKVAPRQLKIGKNKMTALYKGDGYTNRSKDSLTIRVRR